MTKKNDEKLELRPKTAKPAGVSVEQDILLHSVRARAKSGTEEKAALATEGKGLGHHPPMVLDFAVPESWGDLPASATFRAEVSWVHQNFQLMVRRRKGKDPVVTLDRAMVPPPSNGALDWLEYAVTYRNSFLKDIVPKALGSGEEDGGEDVKKERKSIVEIEEVLERFLEVGNG